MSSTAEVRLLVYNAMIAGIQLYYSLCSGLINTARILS